MVQQMEMQEQNMILHSMQRTLMETACTIILTGGDGTNTGWIGLYPHCTVVTVPHTYANQRTYIIKAKAKDTYGAEGEWGEFEVTMPRNRAFNFILLEWLFEQFPNAFPLLKILLNLQ